MRPSDAFNNWTAKARAVSIEHEIDRRGIKLRGGVERVGPCPICGGEDRFAINTKKGVWNCRGCDVGGDVIKLVEHLDGVDFIGACTTLTGERRRRKRTAKIAPPSRRKIVAAEYPYDEDENGAVAFVVERIEYQNLDGTFVVTKDGKHKKTFRQKRPDPDRAGAWLFNVDGVPVLPYRLPELIEAVATGHTVFIVEGEAKVDNFVVLEHTGDVLRRRCRKVEARTLRIFARRRHRVGSRQRRRGWAHINQVGAALAGVAARIRVLALPGLSPKGDVIDWRAAGGTREQLDALIEQAPEWQTTPSNAYR